MMTRRLSAAVALALVCTLAQAETVSMSEARKHAGRFFSTDSNLELTESAGILGSSASTFYVVNNPSGGWMILSAEDSATPILAYSPTGSFPTSDLPAAAGEWMRAVDRGISGIRAKGITQTRAIKEKWEGIGVSTKAGSEGVVLKTADWSQGAPYNNLCPNYDSSHSSMTGCVATAMAIVMRYHRWPEHGTGTIGGYTTTTHKLKISSLDISTHTYDWDNMPLTYDSESTAAQQSAVATLMRDCAVMVEMDFDDASGAYTENIVPALTSHMGYSSTARLVNMDNYGALEWFNMLKAEIDAERPVIYGGSTAGSSSGHEFVCDGYDSSNMLHINWGWGGHANGFFALTYLGDTEEQGGSVGYVFTAYNDAVLGITPDKEGTGASGTPELFLRAHGSLSGLNISDGNIRKGGNFSLVAGDILNASTVNSYEGSLRVALIDKDGELKEAISAQESFSLAKSSDYYYSSATATLDCGISADVAPGDAICLQYLLPDGSWERVGSGLEDIRGVKAISLLGVYDACMIATPGTYEEGECIYPSLIQGHKMVRDVKWSYDGAELTRGYATAQKGTHSLNAVVTFSDGTCETVVHPIKVR